MICTQLNVFIIPHVSHTFNVSKLPNVLLTCQYFFDLNILSLHHVLPIFNVSTLSNVLSHLDVSACLMFQPLNWCFYNIPCFAISQYFFNQYVSSMNEFFFANVFLATMFHVLSHFDVSTQVNVSTMHHVSQTSDVLPFPHVLSLWMFLC